jgi:hypothetical protein
MAETGEETGKRLQQSSFKMDGDHHKFVRQPSRSRCVGREIGILFSHWSPVSAVGRARTSSVLEQGYQKFLGFSLFL